MKKAFCDCYLLWLFGRIGNSSRTNANVSSSNKAVRMLHLCGMTTVYIISKSSKPNKRLICCSDWYAIESKRLFAYVPPCAFKLLSTCHPCSTLLVCAGWDDVPRTSYILSGQLTLTVVSVHMPAWRSHVGRPTESWKRLISLKLCSHVKTFLCTWLSTQSTSCSHIHHSARLFSDFRLPKNATTSYCRLL